MKAGCTAAVVGSVMMIGAATAGDNFKLPPQVTPKLRAACETDVRRLCVGTKPTVAKVKSCVMRKFTQLGRRCQYEIAAAGLRR